MDRLTDDEQRMLDENTATAPSGDEHKLPAWVKIPVNFAPPPGEIVGYVRLPKELTRAAEDHQVILWELTLADERAARARAKARGDSDYLDDLAMQMIRAIDGVKADWSGAPGPSNVRSFWDSGARYRGRAALKTIFQRMHSIELEESMRFFAQCVRFESA